MDGWTDGRTDGQTDGRTDRQADGWMGRRTDRQTSWLTVDWLTDILTDSQTERQTNKWTDGHTDQTNRLTDKHTGRHTVSQTNIRADTQSAGQTNKQTNKQTDTHVRASTSSNTAKGSYTKSIGNNAKIDLLACFEAQWNWSCAITRDVSHLVFPAISLSVGSPFVCSPLELFRSGWRSNFFFKEEIFLQSAGWQRTHLKRCYFKTRSFLAWQISIKSNERLVNFNLVVYNVCAVYKIVRQEMATVH